jgi:Xaa-Pro dipeptidase
VADFTLPEFQARTAKAQALMADQNLDALFFTTEAEIRYFTGFRTLFWQSPTRPWFLVIPKTEAPIAVIPSIGADLMGRTWVKDIRCWASPNPEDEGLSLLLDALKPYARVGTPMGAEASLRMPLADFDRIRRLLGCDFLDATPLIQTLRMVKSAAEIEIIRQICAIGSRTFARADQLFHPGQALSQAFRAFKVALLNEGAEEVPYLVGGAGQGGYGDVISPASDAPLATGDVLMLDTGATLKGYFCDFDRNFAIGQASVAAQQAHQTLWQATEAGLGAARPGATCAELFGAMQTVIGGTSNVGRLGHGLGMQLTEWPSIAANDHTVLRPGMVMTLEPSMAIGPDKMMVAEENILITEAGAELLTQRAPRDLRVI